MANAQKDKESQANNDDATNNTGHMIGEWTDGVYQSASLGMRIVPVAPVEPAYIETGQENQNVLECQYACDDEEHGFCLMSMYTTSNDEGMRDDELLATAKEKFQPQKTVSIVGKTWYQLAIKSEDGSTSTALYTVANHQLVVMSITDSIDGRSVELFMNCISAL